MICVIEVSSRRVVELARRSSAWMSALSSCPLPFESMCGFISPTGSEAVMQPARLRNFSTVPLTGVVGGVRAASCVAFGSVHAVVERVTWLEREAVLRAAGRGDLVVVGVFEVWHGEAGLTHSCKKRFGLGGTARMGRD